jgi:hypothetical protein
VVLDGTVEGWNRSSGKAVKQGRPSPVYERLVFAPCDRGRAIDRDRESDCCLVKFIRFAEPGWTDSI